MRYTIPIAILLIGACTPGVPTYTVSDVEFNAAPGSRAPHLAATPDGAVMSWWDRLEGRRYALRVAERRAGVWSDPRTVVEGDHFFVNWADFPSVTVMADGTWLAHWLEKTADATYAYHVRLATSRDRGATWSDAVTPHDDRSPTEHGFVSVEPWQGGAALVWLDGRQMAEWYEQGGPQGHAADPRGSMSLRFTALGGDGSLGTDIPIDERTCECCQTALTAVPGALVAAYRDRSEEEIRDIAVVRYADGVWTEPRHVGSDNWHYPGCPVNGPQLAAHDNTVAVAWFAAPESQPRVQVAFSTDGGASFGTPVRVDDGLPSGRVDIVALPDGAFIVVWLELTDEEAEIRARWVRQGEMGESWLITPTRQARASGFPRITLAGDDLLIAWTEVGDEGGVRVAVARSR